MKRSNQKKVKWDRKARFIQNMACKKYFKRIPNSFVAQAEPKDTIREDGVRLITEIPYAAKYPNSFLDVYVPRKDLAEQWGEKGTPVFVYFHGGGFLFGHKMHGDPLTKEPSGIHAWLNSFLDRGIAIVSSSYAFAPDYRFPVQIEQVDQVLNYVIAHGAEYGMDTGRILLGGGSAGADMTEVYGMYQSDAEYASHFPFTSAVPRENIKGLIIDEAALCFNTFREKAMETMLGSWVGEEDFLHGPNSILCDVPEHIKGQFIPSFVTGSTKAHYFVQSALKLKAVLDDAGIYCEIYYPPLSMGTVDHGFMEQMNTPAAMEGNKKLMKFVDTVLAE